jgi:hypothetical protein
MQSFLYLNHLLTFVYGYLKKKHDYYWPKSITTAKLQGYLKVQ